MQERRYHAILLGMFAASLFAAPALFAADNGCISILDANAALKAHFLGTDPKNNVLVDEHFTDNRNNWPETDAHFFGRPDPWHGDFNIKHNSYQITIPERDNFHITVPGNYERSNDYLVEICYQITKGASDSDFGILWDTGSSDPRLTAGAEFWDSDIYRKLRVNGLGEFQYSAVWFDRYTQHSRTNWTHSDAASNGGTNTISVVRTGGTVSVYLNGSQISEAKYTSTGRRRIGFTADSGSDEESIVVYSLTALQAPKWTPTPVTSKELYRKLKSGNRSGKFIIASPFRVDVCTNALEAFSGSDPKFGVEPTDKPGPLELGVLLSDNASAAPVPEAQSQLFDRIIAAYAADLPEQGEMLFDSLLTIDPALLYQNNYVEKIVEEKLPLKLAGKLLLAVKDAEKSNPDFWYEYARVAGLANQPALVLQGAEQLKSTATDAEFKDEILDGTAIFKALGFTLLGKDKEALGALIMQPSLRNSLITYATINNAAPALLKDKARLATVLGIDQKCLVGKYAVPKQQAFYNLETGQLVEPIAAAPKLEAKEPQEKPSSKTLPQTPKATVLD